MKKILVVEDNDDIRNNTAEILQLSNYEVIVAENGKVGIEKALQHQPDLIICDIMMPVLDGYGVLHAMQKNESIRYTPFIFMTAKTERGDLRKGMELGADDYITKPFSGTELLNAVDSRLKKNESLKQEFGNGKQGFQNLLQATFGQNVLKELAENRNSDKYKKKQRIYTEGNYPNRLFYLLRGKVKIYKQNDEGKELIMELFGPGDFLGYNALLEGGVYRDTAEALEDCELAIIPKEEFEGLVNNNKEVSRKFISILAKNVSDKEDQLLGLAYNSLRKKVADALVTLHKKYAIIPQEYVIDMSRENLAMLAGTATESLIRTLSDFRSEKLIQINDGMITFLNYKKLEQLLN